MKAQHLDTVFVSPWLASSELFDQTSTELWQTILFQIVNMKIHVANILVRMRIQPPFNLRERCGQLSLTQFFLQI